MNIESEVRAFYNKFPYPSFNIKSHRHLIGLPFQKLLLNITRKYIKDGKILDAGCGTGELALLMAQNGYKSFGVDTADESLQIGKKTAKRLSLWVTFEKMDILSLTFPDDSYDATIANGVLHHTKNPLLGFKNLLRVTKPKGIIVVVVYNKLGSLPRKVYAKIGKLFGGDSLESQVQFIRKFLPKKYKNMPDSVIADAFFNPYETAFSVSEIIAWFKKNKVRFLECSPSIKAGRYLPYLFLEAIWMLTLRGNVFVMVGEKIKD